MHAAYKRPAHLGAAELFCLGLGESSLAHVVDRPSSPRYGSRSKSRWPRHLGAGTGMHTYCDFPNTPRSVGTFLVYTTEREPLGQPVHKNKRDATSQVDQKGEIHTNTAFLYRGEVPMYVYEGRPAVAAVERVGKMLLSASDSKREKKGTPKYRSVGRRPQLSLS